MGREIRLHPDNLRHLQKTNNGLKEDNKTALTERGGGERCNLDHCFVPFYF